MDSASMDVAEDRASIAVRAEVLFVVVLAAWFFLVPRRPGHGPGLEPVLVLVVALLAFVAWVRWFGALYRAAAELRPVRLTTPGIWWWCWLVPGVSLVLPKMLVNDVWRAGRDDPKASPPPVVQVWWGLSVTAGLLQFAPDPIEVVAVVPLVGYLVLAPLVVRVLTRRVRAGHDARLAAAAAAAPVPVP